MPEKATQKLNLNVEYSATVAGEVQVAEGAQICNCQTRKKDLKKFGELHEWNIHECKIIR